MTLKGVLIGKLSKEIFVFITYKVVVALWLKRSCVANRVYYI